MSSCSHYYIDRSAGAVDICSECSLELAAADCTQNICKICSHCSSILCVLCHNELYNPCNHRWTRRANLGRGPPCTGCRNACGKSSVYCPNCNLEFCNPTCARR